MYQITRESVTAEINSNVAEKAVCWCEGRKKRSRRILRRLTHLTAPRRLIETSESGITISSGNFLNRAAKSAEILNPLPRPAHPIQSDVSELSPPHQKEIHVQTK